MWQFTEFEYLFHQLVLTLFYLKAMYLLYSILQSVAYLMLLVSSFIILAWFCKLIDISLLRKLSFFIEFVRSFVIFVSLLSLCSSYLLTCSLLFEIILLSAYSIVTKSSWSGLPATYFHAEPIQLIDLVWRVLNFKVIVWYAVKVWVISRCSGGYKLLVFNSFSML